MEKAVFDKLAAAENEFYNSQFLSPVLSGSPIRVRIANVIVDFTITRPKKFQGWGVFRPVGTKEARRVRDANLKERNEYLTLFPCLRLILCRRTEEGQWYGVHAHNDPRFKVQGVVPVHLTEEVQMFNVVKTAYDGKHCWFGGIETKSNPRIGVYLRESITKEIVPNQLSFSGMTQQERHAYDVAFIDLIESLRDRTEERIKKAIEHGGGEYLSYVERADSFTIEYSVDGQHHRSTVDKENLQVQTSGICLAGEDRKFDLYSLVGVMREGQEGRGRGYYHDEWEEDY